MKFSNICINIPTKNLERSVNFYTQLGFEPHPIFRGPDCQNMVLTDQIHIMVHLDSSLKNFTPKAISDPMNTTGAVLCLLCDSQEQVDHLVTKALANEGSTYDDPQDLGFIYTHGFLDPDGNVWRLNYLNPNIPIPQ